MRSKSYLVCTPRPYFRAEDNEPLVNKQYPRPKQMPNLNLMLNLKIASDVDVLVTKDGQTMAEMKTAYRRVFVRADLRAHLFGFIHLTERATHAHPLHPAALASVPYGIVLVRVRVLSITRPATLLTFDPK